MPLLELPPKELDYSDKVIDLLVKRSEVVSEVNAEYPYWTKVKYLGKKFQVDTKDLWSALKIRRRSQSERLFFGDPFYFNITPTLQRDLHELDKHCGGSLESIATIPNNLRERFIISSLETEAYSSSVLEGAVATRDRAKELLRLDKKPRNKSERMILNNYLAMEFIRENKNRKLTEELLLELHTILSRDALDQGMSGEFRKATDDVVVFDDYEREVVYTPPPSSQLGARMHDLITFFNYKDSEGAIPFSSKKDAFVHPILRATIIHFLVGYIHPFADGNGRIARALFYWHMLANGYWLAEYLSISQVILESKNQYYYAFLQVEQDDNDLTYFLLYHTKSLRRSFELLKEYLHRKLYQQSVDIADEAQKLGITPRQAQLLNMIRKNPSIWTVAQAESYLHVSHATARGELRALTEKRLLVLSPLDKKTQGWRLA